MGRSNRIARWNILTFAAVAISFCGQIANATWTLSDVGGGPLSPPATSGSYLYVGTGVTIDVFDLSDPSNPVLLDRLRNASTAAPIRGIVVVGDTIYAVWGVGTDVLGGVSIYSIADPRHPVFMAELDGYASDSMTTADGYVYLGSGQAGTVVLDAHDPLNPIVVGGADAPKLGVIEGLAVVDNVLFEVGEDFFGDQAIVAYDVSEPAQMNKLGDFTDDGDKLITSITIENGYAIGVGGNLQVLDLHDPAHITEVFSALIHPSKRALVDGNVLYVFGDATLQVWDNATPSQPALIGTSPIDTSFTDQVVLTPSGPLDLTDRDLGVLLDDTTPETPTVRSAFAIPVGVDVQAAVVDGRNAYLAEYDYGFAVIDVDSFEPLGRFNVVPPQDDLEANDLAQEGTRVYLLAGNAGLFIVDAGDPAHPSELGRYALDIPNRVAVNADRAYVTSELFGTLTLLDVSDPANVQTLGVLEGVYARDLVIRGSRVFMATDGDFVGDGGLRIADVSDEATPQLVGSYFGCGPFEGNALAANDDGTLVYLGCDDGTLQILDTHDATNPTLVGTYALTDTFATSLSVGLRDGRAYLGHSVGVDEIDVENPALPVFISRLPTNSSVNRIVVPSAGRLLAVTATTGVYRFDEDAIFNDGFE